MSASILKELSLPDPPKPKKEIKIGDLQSLNKSQLIRLAGQVLDENCKNCKAKAKVRELGRKYKRDGFNEEYVQRYCIDLCPVVPELNKIGNMLCDGKVKKKMPNIS